MLIAISVVTGYRTVNGRDLSKPLGLRRSSCFLQICQRSSSVTCRQIGESSSRICGESNGTAEATRINDGTLEQGDHIFISQRPKSEQQRP